MKIWSVFVVAAMTAVIVGSGSAASQAPSTNSYIVTFTDDVADPGAVAAEHARAHQAQVSLVYSHALKGYAATVTDRGLSAIARDRRVANVERDGIASIVDTQNGATWGLDRIDQRSRPVDGTYTTNVADGTGVTAYIIDTGIRTSHSEFGGRAVFGTDTVDGGQAAIDCNGHGTHVASTVGGSNYGVAQGVTLVAVRVLNCAGSGSWSGVIAGIDWVTENHLITGGPAVANMSLGGSASAAVDKAVSNSIADGVSYAIAAGNGNFVGIAQDACKSSPARVPAAMTVSATDQNDRKASWANYGKCVDWFAPGVGITSAWSDGGIKTISGTSMATPHTAGVAALYLQTHSGASPAAVRDALYANTTKGVVTA